MNVLSCEPGAGQGQPREQKTQAQKGKLRNHKATHLDPEVFVKLDHLVALGEGRRFDGEKGQDLVHHGVKLVNHDKLVLLCKLEPVVEPFRRSAPVPPLVFCDRLLERLALPCDFGLPGLFAFPDQVMDRMGLVLDIGGRRASDRLTERRRRIWRRDSWVEQVPAVLLVDEPLERIPRLSELFGAVFPPGQEGAEFRQPAVDRHGR